MFDRSSSAKCAFPSHDFGGSWSGFIRTKSWYLLTRVPEDERFALNLHSKQPVELFCSSSVAVPPGSTRKSFNHLYHFSYMIKGGTLEVERWFSHINAAKWWNRCVLEWAKSWNTEAVVHSSKQIYAKISLEASGQSATGCFHLRVLRVVNDKWTYVHIETFGDSSLVRFIIRAQKASRRALPVSLLMSSLCESAVLGPKLRPPDQWWSTPEPHPPS